MKLFLLFIFVGMFFGADFARAQIVPPCVTGASVCDFCDFAQMVQNLINFLTYQIAVPLSILLTVAGGGLLILSGANAGFRTTAKNILTTTVIGLLVVFLSWVIINTIILTVVGGSQPAPGVPWPWNEIVCP